MKISAVENSNINNIALNRNVNTSFKGISDGFVKFWQMVDAGGRAAQFTVEDMCGTNLPRSYKGAMAGYKYTGKINYAALLQEAIREFMTGPTMCLMPVAILGIAKKSLGKTSDTHIENIKNLSYIMNQAIKNSRTQNINSDFIYTAVIDMLKNTTANETVDEADAKLLTQEIINYGNLVSSRGLSKKELADSGLKKATKKQIKNTASKLEEMFEGIVKKSKESYQNTGFQQAKYSISEVQTGTFNFKNYLNYMVNYANDFSKYIKKGAKQVTFDTIENFKSGWVAKRFGIIAAMIGITGLAMSNIPKLYTKASGNVNPNAKTIYNEAEKLSPKKKEVKA